MSDPPPSKTASQKESSESSKEPVYKLEDGKEVYGMQKENLPPIQSMSINPIPEPKEQVKESDLLDPEDAVISIGSKCKRKGCNGTYNDDSSRKESCIYHPGAPVFHEGSKGWSCCPRKVLEFDEFLKIKGCQTGVHRFTDVVSSEVESRMVECRRDWYQTPTHVILSIFAKKCSREKTRVSFQENQVCLL